MPTLNGAQYNTELKKCLQCGNHPCDATCPAGVNPHDFIKAALEGTNEGMYRATALVMSKNPLGGICGFVCPDKHCMSKCTRSRMDMPINIPFLQATIISRARSSGAYKVPELKVEDTGKKVAIIGSGPAGLTATSFLSRNGVSVTLFEARDELGGAVRLIPTARLPRDVLDADIEDIVSVPNVTVRLNERIEDPSELLKEYDAVVIAVGCMEPRLQRVPGEDHAAQSIEYLTHPEKFDLGDCVAVVGGGAVAIDCAVTAKRMGASQVRIIYRRGMGEMPLSAAERRELFLNGIDVVSRTVVTEVLTEGDKVTGLKTKRVNMARRATGSTSSADIPGSEYVWSDITGVVFAIGLVPSLPMTEDSQLPVGLFNAGDCTYGASTVVEAVAHAKTVAAQTLSYLLGTDETHAHEKTPTGYVSSKVSIPGFLE